jgi:serine protease Do
MGTAWRRAAGMACLLGAAAGSAQGVDPVAPELLFERLAPSVWSVETFDARNQLLAGGSAVVIGPGSLVTNCHVLAKAKRVAVTRENVSYGATLEHPDPERDLCLLKVRNFNAPAVTVGSIEALKIGSRVYAIGSPRGLEQTISDGLLSGVRRSASGDFTALQVTVPISPGSSGGGLFDTQGRLIGITTFVMKESQNLNFAMPASWIAEVPERARTALAARSAPLPATGAAVAAGTPGHLSVGRVYEYRLTDRTTRKTQSVIYQVDRIEGERVIFNQGMRVENRTGEVLSVGGAIGGEADGSMPPGGWFKAGAAVGSTWRLDYQSGLEPQRVQYQLQARVTGGRVLAVAGRDIQTLQVEFTGYIDRSVYVPGAGTGRYKATAWYAPELGRLVRFEVYANGGATGANRFLIDEVLELAAIR